MKCFEFFTYRTIEVDFKDEHHDSSLIILFTICGSLQKILIETVNIIVEKNKNEIKKLFFDLL